MKKNMKWSTNVNQSRIVEDKSMKYLRSSTDEDLRRSKTPGIVVKAENFSEFMKLKSKISDNAYMKTIKLMKIMKGLIFCLT